MRLSTRAVALLIAAALIGCAHKAANPTIGDKLQRQGDEIVIAGQFFHTGAPVVTWLDEGGYDAYRTERRFAPWEEADFEHSTKAEPEIKTPNRYGVRFATTQRAGGTTGTPLTPEELKKVRGGGWPLKMVQDKVDQFVIHFDVDYSSRQCFQTLHDSRCLSVQFMLDVDGTIYQTLDVKERAWQATIANNRSVGIEIANIGCYRGTNLSESAKLQRAYTKGPDGRVRVDPDLLTKAGGVKTPNFVAYPFRQEPVVGEIQHRQYMQYDYTPQQYDSLIKLTATLCKVLPKLKCDYPKDEKGQLIPHTLTPEQFEKYQGVLGHYHVQDNKQDPGPALQWDRVINGARKLMGLKPLPPGDPYEQTKGEVVSSKK